MWHFEINCLAYQNTPKIFKQNLITQFVSIFFGEFHETQLFIFVFNLVKNHKLSGKIKRKAIIHDTNCVFR